MSRTVRGIALAPGVSKNNRLYTRENITRAYDRLRARIADPSGRPVVMRTHHAAGDDSTRIVAQVTDVSLDEQGAIHYAAKFASTGNADTIRELAKPQPNGKPPLAHVSIYGWWMDEPEKVDRDGLTVETADDLEIDAIDFTASPGVLATSARAENTTHAYAIHESHDAEITVTETATAVIEADSKSSEPYGNVTYADPGYQKDGKKRYPVDTADHVRAAWSYINQADNTKPYTAAQVKRIKTRIRTAAKKVGVKIADSWLYSGSPLGESAVTEGYWVDTDMKPMSSFAFDATNGPINVRISSWCIDPADLEVVTKAACQAANDALKALDPDMDADIDLPGLDTGDDESNTSGDDQMETTQTPDAAPAVTETLAEQAETETEAAVSESTTDTTTQGAAEAAPAAEATPVKVEIDYKALAEAFFAVQKAAVEAQAETSQTSETTESASETDEPAETAAADPAQLREAMKDVVRELLTESKVNPTRKGYGLTENGNAGPEAAELWEKRGELFIAAARENRNLGL